MANQGAEDKRDTVAQCATGRADNQQGDKTGYNHRQERRQDQIQGIGDCATQLLLNDAHKPYCQQYREHRTLIADHGNFEAEKVHGVETRGHAPGVSQRWMSQNAAKRRAEIRITAEFAGGGKANQNRQNDKCRRAAHIQHDVDGVARVNPAVCFDHSQQAHQQTRGDDGRDYRHEDV